MNRKSLNERLSKNKDFPKFVFEKKVLRNNLFTVNNYTPMPLSLSTAKQIIRVIHLFRKRIFLLEREKQTNKSKSQMNY